MPFSPAARGLLCSVAVALAIAPLAADDAEFCVAGTVLNAITGEPLRRAAVTIPQAAGLTGPAGDFRFCNLPAGAYFANAEKPGFTAAGARVLVGPSREDVLLRLVPLSVVSGIVADAGGDPLPNVLIQLLAIFVRDGRRHVLVQSSVTTDDRGQYRLPGVTSGRYYLRAAGWADAPEPNAHEAFAPLYYGGAPELPSADPVSVEPGHDLRADFSLNLGTAYRIRGTLTGFSPLLPARIELLGAGTEPISTRVALNSATGVFQIDDVAPGSYLLRATQGEGPKRLRGELPLQVTAGVNGVVVALAGGAHLDGTVRVADSQAAEPVSPKCAITLSAEDAWSSGEDRLGAVTEPDGEFSIEGLSAGRYQLGIHCAKGYVSAARMGDADLMASGEVSIAAAVPPAQIEAVLSADGGTVEVTASTEGEAGPAWVLLRPASGSPLHTGLARLPSPGAKFTFPELAPGDYQAYAWTSSAEAFEYANPDALQAWSGRAVNVQVGARGHESVTVKITGGDPP